MNDKTTLKSEKTSFFENVKSKLSLLGSTLMLPISLLAFGSIFLGFSSTVPDEMLLSTYLSTIASVVYSLFPIGVYIAIIGTFHKKKNTYTYISAGIFLGIFIAIQSVVVGTGIIPDMFVSSMGPYSTYDGYIQLMTPISMSMFAVILMASVFIWLDGWIIHKQMFFVYGIIATLLLTPIFILMSVALYIMGWAISMIPFGIGTFLYAFINRLLLPFGLHSLWFPTFLYTAAGGTLYVYQVANEGIEIDVNADIFQTINGDKYIFYYMLDHNIFTLATEDKGYYEYGSQWYYYEMKNTTNPAQYTQGFIAVLSYTFPLLAIAVIMKDGWREKKHFLLMAIVTMWTGVTELVEFNFIYLNPFLYLLNAFIFGIAFMLLDVLNVSVGTSTSWCLDIIFFGIIPWMNGFINYWYYIPMVGLSLGVVYGSLFLLVERVTCHKFETFTNQSKINNSKQIIPIMKQ